MGDEKKPDSPQLANLREREKVLIDKVANLEKVDANHQERQGWDLNDVKNRAKLQLAEVRSEIAKLK